MITIKSHGFKFSRPDANFVFDVSYFKNPWRDPDVRSGKKSAEECMTEQDGFCDVVNSIASVIISYHKLFPEENYQVAVCCSAGEYRSPATARAISRILSQNHIPHILNVEGERTS